MDKAVKRDWIEALRSGEYKQTQGQLCKAGRMGDAKFCCLGVLVDVGLDATWESRRGYDWGINGEYGSLSLQMMMELGISQFYHGNLITMNDEGSTFDEIADYIEENM